MKKGEFMKKYAVITGASSGIGAEFARQLAKQGYALILTARRKDRLEKLSRQLRTDCEIIPADLTDLSECRRVFEFIKDKNIEIFINNAGFGDCSPFLAGSLEKELQMIDLNIRAVHYFTKRVLQKMQKAGYGYLLNVASSAGLIPAGPYMASYYAAKSYTASLTRAVAAELAESRSSVYVGCLCPGPVDTEFNRVANVQFKLNGISATSCVSYALRQMALRKTVVIPSLRMRFVIFFGRFIPESLYIRLVSFQQKKKIYRPSGKS